MATLQQPPGFMLRPAPSDLDIDSAMTALGRLTAGQRDIENPFSYRALSRNNVLQSLSRLARQPFEVLRDDGKE
jgi:hypothetical protein